ncbi:predicted protein [Pyrenophora tritici-repentis Pt-1C-BFP]|uniref:Uncharacterized protein n=1 Tax=Pyrenophora tritici-repentis (strain Pt-1C-BFP) TaxID=426418 RepID=B2W0X2_PYRTR|nr:uncharacterized protein PTRG_04107 [Pyrenophora tritici-repentis Pt-1C-BFP]EDU46945.1 predicted protein [Pyrenophora tritici-repentis Pt-1C-BFP]
MVKAMVVGVQGSDLPGLPWLAACIMAASVATLGRAMCRRNGAPEALRVQCPPNCETGLDKKPRNVPEA